MKQLILIIALIASSFALASYLIKSTPEPRKRVRQPVVPVVDIMTPQLQSYTLKIRSSGSVESNLSTNIVAEVSGKVTSISPVFEEGSYFRKGDLLLSIDNTNYRNAIVIATAEVSQRMLEVKTEQNLANLAERDFKLYGANRRPTDIAARKPHIASAMANLDAAKVRLEQARDDLNKTRILAPYDGRLLSRSVNVGQYITAGTLVGQVYSSDYVEVRLPLSLSEYEELDLPEIYSNQKVRADQWPEVSFSAKYAEKQHEWKGRIVRTAAAMDARTRQIAVIARIENPFSKKVGSDAPPVKVGQFLQAQIIGSTLKNVYVIPTRSTRQNREVMLYDEGKIRIKPIEVLARENDQLVISSDSIPVQAKLITTPMPSAKDGMAVRLVGEKTEDRPTKGGGGRPEGGKRAGGANGDKPANAAARQGSQRPASKTSAEAN
ncbi:efflux RND transporter periplasmic adaptor subunit [Leucothrix mucor]|uniref:efflux RND transporter periplasmic adaptor subunit n=1 Tax=Leucothrix mucor TaxID=45248 RepID=UPI0003B47412|nr:efflux RND transporter periplasmic adaptor subunit [Leucothrix mucor]